jgi:hypothetical protein
MPNYNGVWSLSTHYQNRTGWPTFDPTRGVFAGGATPDDGGFNTIEYIEISTKGNASDFGDLTVARGRNAGFGSTTRGVFGGGTDNSNALNTIDYITISSTGNASDFGDLSSVKEYVAGLSNSTRGVFGGGMNGFSDIKNVI